MKSNIDAIYKVFGTFGAMIELQRSRISEPIDFAQRLLDAIADESTHDSIAGQKTAIYLLKNYITEAYAEYITENKDIYPETIDLHIDKKVDLDYQLFGKYSIPSVKWSDKTENGENLDKMKKDIQSAYKKAEQSAIEQVKPSKGMMVAVSIFTLGIGALILNNKFKKRSAEITLKYNNECKAQIAKLETNEIYKNVIMSLLCRCILKALYYFNVLLGKL